MAHQGLAGAARSGLDLRQKSRPSESRYRSMAKAGLTATGALASAL